MTSSTLSARGARVAEKDAAGFKGIAPPRIDHHVGDGIGGNKEVA